MMRENASNSNTQKIRVAAVQMVSENNRISDNLAHATPLIEQASQQGAQVVLLPEFMPTGYYLGKRMWEAGETMAGPTVQWLKETSKKLEIWLGTSFLEADGRDFFNSFVLTNPEGEVSGRVRKQTPATWEAYLFRGETGSHSIVTPLGKVGVSICFDSHTADVITILGKESVDLVLMPHSFPVPAVSAGVFQKERMLDHLQMLAPLCTSLLGVPAVLANKCGPWVSPVPGPQIVNTAGSYFPGLSTIIDSDGAVRATLGGEEGVIVAEISLDPARKKHAVVPHYGRYIYPGPRSRSIIRLLEAVGRLSYKFSSRRSKMARAISKTI